MATRTSDGRGYWLVGSDGGIFAFGDAAFTGSTGGLPLNAPVVGMAADRHRARLLAGGARTAASSPSATPPFHGSAGGLPLAARWSGMAADAATGGYWLVGRRRRRVRLRRAVRGAG